MTTRTRTLVATFALLAALTACSAGDGGATQADMDSGVAVEESRGGAYDATGDDTAADGGESGQQVVQTASASLTSPDPVAAARDVVALVTRLDGRVDARSERAGADEDDPGSASLTVRVPASAMPTITDDLARIADVQEFVVQTQDVTGTALDLDARIAATELSVARMSDLLARASTHSDVIEAESALTERQADLERLRSERARLADRVALSTVDVEIWAPADAPEPLDDDPATFLDGLATGWAAFTGFVRGLTVVVGVLLPWLVLGGLVTAAVVVWRRRHPAPARPAPHRTAPRQPAPARPVPPQAADGPADAPAGDPQPEAPTQH